MGSFANDFSLKINPILWHMQYQPEKPIFKKLMQ